MKIPVTLIAITLFSITLISITVKFAIKKFIINKNRTIDSNRIKNLNQHAEFGHNVNQAGRDNNVR